MIANFFRRIKAEWRQAELNDLVERRQKLVAALAAAQIDVDIHLLESAFRLLETMKDSDRLIIANAGDLIKSPEEGQKRIVVFGGTKP